MRLAIITIESCNYGNRLQNYALQELIASLGHEVLAIPLVDGVGLHQVESFGDKLAKLRPSYLWRVASSRFKGRYPYKNQRDGVLTSMRLGKTAIPQEIESLREEGFDIFNKTYIHMDGRNLRSDDVRFADTYDAYICGSDQVWSPTYCTTGPASFLTFVPEHKRIAFAPSFGLSELPEDLRPIYAKWLSGIPHLSVREESGARIIRELIGRDVPVLPDPTLCVPRESWEAIERRPVFDDGTPFVLTYFLGNETNRYRRFVEHQAAGSRIVNLYDMREPEHYVVGPAEFIWLVHHADAMFTDSFHGTVFSLVFHTPFMVFDRVESGGAAMGSRLDTLLDRVGLQDRRFGMAELQDNMDFTHADEAIAFWAHEARAFLQDALEQTQGGASERNPSSPYVLLNKVDCSGCGACAVACPTRCISMETDEEGFRYPVVNRGVCVGCGQCERVCMSAASPGDPANGEAFVAWSRSEEVRRNSSSGGMFSELAGAAIDQGATAYGAAFDVHFDVAHTAATSREELIPLRGSKYVQGKAEHCFREVRDKLKAGKSVYFSGTPCQVDGLLAYLGSGHPNLWTQDIICHGVPSPAAWHGYLALRLEGRAIKDVSFRDKTYGWHYFSLRVTTDRGTYLTRLDEDPCVRLFLSNVSLRPSCYSCRHKHVHRKADLTLADCWGLERLCPEIADTDKGFSLVFANTWRGAELLSQTSTNLVEVPFERATSSQLAMTESVPYNSDREVFFAIANSLGMQEAIRRWFGWDTPTMVKAKLGYVRYMISRTFRKVRR